MGGEHRRASLHVQEAVFTRGGLFVSPALLVVVQRRGGRGAQGEGGAPGVGVRVWLGEPQGLVFRWASGGDVCVINVRVYRCV